MVSHTVGLTPNVGGKIMNRKNMRLSTRLLFTATNGILFIWLFVMICYLYGYEIVRTG